MMRIVSEPVCGTVTVRSQMGRSMENSCSGFLLDSRAGHFLTHGMVLSEHIDEKSHVFKKLQRNLYCSGRDVLKYMPLDVGVSLPNTVLKFSENSDLKMELGITPSSALTERLQENQCIQFPGEVCGIFCVPSLKNILNKLMPSDSWEFGDEQTNKNKKDKSKSLVSFDLLSCFVLIKLHEWVPFQSTFMVKPSSQNYIGDPVEIMSTPFGGLNPDVFLNSRSEGILSNMAGKNKVLLMTDARCVPGSEGGLLLERNNSSDSYDRPVIGVMIATLCWRNNEWVGLSMACALPDILTAMEAIPVSISPTVSNLILNSKSDPALQNLVNSVPLISVRGSWGSGFTVGIHGNKVILLTCNHVVKDCSLSAVRIKWPSGNVYSGKLLYRNVSSPAFDLALLSVKVRPSDLPSIPQTALVEEGEPVFGIGHAVFNEEYDLLPSATSGIVSKVHRMRNKVVMVQTTCAIHAGASGGPIVNRQGGIVGVTVCNAKDVSSGASYPHINMSVPMETVLPIIQQYLQTKDINVLEQLQIKDPYVEGLWGLETKQRGPKFSSKL